MPYKVVEYDVDIEHEREMGEFPDIEQAVGYISAITRARATADERYRDNSLFYNIQWFRRDE